MKLDHISTSENIIDMRATFTPDMDAMYGPAVDVQTAIGSTSPEAILAFGLTGCAITAGILILVGWNIWKGMK